MIKSKSKSKVIITSAVALLLQLIVPQFVGVASAATAFNELYVRFDRMQELTPTTGTVCIKTPAAGVGTEDHVIVEFPKQVINTDYVVDTTAADWAVSTTNLPIDPNTPGTPATAWPGITAPSAVGDFGVGPDGGKTVRFASGNLTASTFYCFNWGPSGATPVVTNGSKYDTAVGGEKALVGRITTMHLAAQINDTEYAADVVSKDNIIVNAVVPPLFTMDLEPTGGTPVAYTGIDAFLSDLSTSATIYTSGVEANITTNAPNGWVTWVKDTNQGLKSAIAGNYTLPTVTAPGPVPGNVALVPDSKQYGSYGTVTSPGVAGSCTPAIDAIYDPHLSAGVPTKIGTLSGTYLTFATCTGASPATADQTKIQIVEAANITPGVPAANDYTDTIYFVGAGNF